MVLESLQKGTQINVRNLTIVNPETIGDLPFDPKRDITPSDWENIKSSFEQTNDITRLNMLRDIVMIAPNLKDEFLSKTIPYDHPDLEFTYFGRRSQISKDFLSWLKIIHPREAAKRLDNPTVIYNFTQIVSTQIKNPSAAAFFNLGDIKICLPQITNSISAPSILNDYMLKDLVDKENTKHPEFIRHIAIYNLLFPRTRYTPKSADWKRMKSKLNQLKTFNDWRGFTQQAMYMAMIWAKEVQIDDSGVRLIMPDSPQIFKANTPPLPETRRF